ncbi:hypothetical protein RJ55_08229 [Drechmeria coniospora]|nr:hypothetical protein RJ55_08229 [Drechmeria coniospora]
MGRALAAIPSAGTPAPNLLYVSSYGGKVVTLDVADAAGSSASGVPKLRTIASTDGGAGTLSWLTLDHGRSTLFGLDEGLSSDRGSLTSFRTRADGSLETLARLEMSPGPVSGVLYGPEDGGLAIAHYSGSALSTWDVSEPSEVVKVQSETFTLNKQPTVPHRQDAPHPHQAFLDPTGGFLVVPDLGTDELRMYAVGPRLAVTPLLPVSVAPGSGPRHVQFAKRGGKTFMYLVAELTCTIVGYGVTYPAGTIKLDELWTIGVHGEGKPVPADASASEIVVSADGRFALVSSRNENGFLIGDFDPSKDGQIVSDPIVNFSIDDDGSLRLLQDVPAGGRVPRQFSMNKSGTLLAVGLQSDMRVVLISRDPETGRLGRFAGYADLEGEITSVVFNE